MSVVVPMAEVKFQGSDLHRMGLMQSFEYVESVYGPSRFNFTSITNEWSRWDAVFRNFGSGLSDVRYGFDFRGNKKWSNWKKVVLNHGIAYMTKSRGDLRMYLRGSCAGYFLSERITSKAYSDMPISDMVEDIAGRNRDVIKDTDILPTKNSFSLYQCSIPDLSFINQELLPRAVSATNQRNYRLYFVDGKKLVFSPLNYTGKTLATFRFAPTQSGPEVLNAPISVKIHYRRDSARADRSLGTQFRGFDVQKKEAVFFHATEDPAIDYPWKGENRNPPAVPKETPMNVSLFAGPTPEGSRNDLVKERGINNWTLNGQSMFRIELVAYPFVRVEIGSIVELDFADAYEQPHFLNGKYMVYALRHKMNFGRNAYASTTFSLERRGVK